MRLNIFATYAFEVMPSAGLSKVSVLVSQLSMVAVWHVNERHFVQFCCMNHFWCTSQALKYEQFEADCLIFDCIQNLMEKAISVRLMNINRVPAMSPPQFFSSSL